jgi:putative oxygen-independent coproporphyrinogen III oxidase
MTPRLPPLSLYVHMPWCVRKCPYCDFNSHAAPAQIPESHYVDALLNDLDQDLPLASQRPLISIFFGGGTPSLFGPESVHRFLDGVRSRIACAQDIEVTLEANPGAVEHGRFAGYREAGVNRISLGVQSLNAAHLQVLGRIHDTEDVGKAVEEIGRAGFANFNLDLMYGLPQQTRAQALADLRSAIAFGPTHLSHYQLTLEPGTAFYHRPPPLPDVDELWDMQSDCQEHLAAAGFEQYEVSAYASVGRQCRHNRNYWLFGDYLGIGAGAHGKLTLASGQILRTTRLRQPRHYLAQSGGDRIAETRAIPAHELPFEFMLNALRLIEGFDVADFEERTGLSWQSVAEVASAAEGRGLLARTDRGWKPSELGMRFLNDLQAMFLAETAPPSGRELPPGAHASS